MADQPKSAFSLSELKDAVELLDKFAKNAEPLIVAQAQLSNTMKDMGTYSQEAFDKAIKGANELSKNILYSQADIINLQAQLGLTGDIGQDEMNQLIKASADMASKFGGSLADAGNTIDKASRNPAKLQELADKLTIDPETIAHIRNLEELGKTVQARMELIAAVEQKVGGAAKAAFDANPLAGYNKSIESINISLGQIAGMILVKLAPALEWAAQKLSDFANWCKENKWLIDDLGGLVSVLAGSFLGVKLAQEWMLVKAALVEAWELWQISNLPELITYYTGLGNSTWAFGGAVSGLSISLGLAGAAIGGYLYYISQLKDKTGETIGIVQHLKDVGNDVMLSFKGMGEGLGKMLGGLGYASWDLFKDGLSTFYDGLISDGSQSENARVNARLNANAGFDLNNDDELYSHLSSALSTKPKATKNSSVLPGNTSNPVLPAPTQASGTKSVTLTININKLIETFKIQTSNISDSYGKIEEQVANALLAAANDVSLQADI